MGWRSLHKQPKVRLLPLFRIQALKQSGSGACGRGFSCRPRWPWWREWRYGLPGGTIPPGKSANRWSASTPIWGRAFRCSRRTAPRWRSRMTAPEWRSLRAPRMGACACIGGGWIKPPPRRCPAPSPLSRRSFPLTANRSPSSRKVRSRRSNLPPETSPSWPTPSIPQGEPGARTA